MNRKHTRFGEQRFAEAISLAVQSLQSFRQTEAERIKRMQYTDISPEKAQSLIFRAYRQRLISHRYIDRVADEWEKPSFEEFEPRTAWSLLNAFTTVLSDRQRINPQGFAQTTIGLQSLLEVREVREEDSVPLPQAVPA